MRNYEPSSSRRDFFKLAFGAALVVSVPACGTQSATAAIEAALADLERQAGGRLGVGILWLEGGDISGHRTDERFGMCSTFKLLLAAVILREAQERRLDLSTPVSYTEKNMLEFAPVTKKYLARGFMTIAELAEAAQKTSDNVAANLLLDRIGGPPGFTEKLREIGDDTTRLDRFEPDMNLVLPGELRDTTTPGAMAATVRRVLSGPVLSAESKELLRAWMAGTQTGLSRLRAGFPSDWRAGDKTGTAIADGMSNKYNDVAVAWPGDESKAFVIAAFYEADGHYDDMRDQDVAVLKSVGEIVARGLIH
ncbi:MAG TPA: class A beta-lactamase [Woeseiaceae bacterium]|nr:class A beta-lactamase [Woeseiaceae bacterium]